MYDQKFRKHSQDTIKTAGHRKPKRKPTEQGNLRGTFRLLRALLGTKTCTHGATNSNIFLSTLKFSFLTSDSNSTAIFTSEKVTFQNFKILSILPSN